MFFCAWGLEFAVVRSFSEIGCEPATALKDFFCEPRTLYSHPRDDKQEIFKCSPEPVGDKFVNRY